MAKKETFLMIPDKLIKFDKTKLSWIEKLIFCKIKSYASNEMKYCYATNQHLADYFGVCSSTVSKSVSKLQKLDLIDVKVDHNYNRQIFIK